MRTYLTLSLLVLGAIVVPQVVRADVPVLSFSANPTYVQNAYSVGFAWQTTGGYGANMYFNCPTGVSIKNEQGNSVSCGTAIAVGGVASNGSAGFDFFNFSGSDKVITVRLVPKDISGAEQSLNAATVSVTVGGAVLLITDFSASTLTPKSGDSVKISWKSVYINGVNLQFDCAEPLSVFTVDSNPRGIKCGALVSSSELAASGSYDFKVVNASHNSASFGVTVIPSQGGGLYDGSKSVSLSFTVAAQVAPVSASISSFTASKSKILSNESFNLNWNTLNAKGVNLQFQCPSSNVVVYAVNGTTTTPLACNTLAFNPPLAPSGTTMLTLVNKDPFVSFADVVIMLLPQQADGSYSGVNSKTVTMSVSSGSTPITQPPTINPPVTTPVLPPSASPVKTVFSLSLGRGSRGAQVSALQEFLAKDKAIYPEGLVTGYFGAASEAAIKRFQVRYGIAKQGDAGYGYVGPKTRTKLNSLSTP